MQPNKLYVRMKLAFLFELDLNTNTDGKECQFNERQIQITVKYKLQLNTNRKCYTFFLFQVRPTEASGVCDKHLKPAEKSAKACFVL